jgi:polyisoprenoid-binding protein YceI
MTFAPGRTAPQYTPTPGRYAIDPQRTSVRFTARHLFGLAGINGTISLLRASAVIDDPATSSTMVAVLDAASFTSGNRWRDRAVRSAKYLDVANHPVITVTSSQAQCTQGTWIAECTISAHGVDAPSTLTVEQLDFPDGGLILRGSATVDRYAHGITAGKGIAGRWITLHIDAVATLAAPQPR